MGVEPFRQQLAGSGLAVSPRGLYGMGTSEFMNRLQTGKEQYNLPIYTNVMLGENGFEEPGACYNSGAAVGRVLDIYKKIADFDRSALSGYVCGGTGEVPPGAGPLRPPG